MGRDLPQLMFLFLYGCTSVKGTDPCTDNEVLRFQDSRCPSNLLASNSPGLCDNFITERWYRVDEGSDIPTSCQNLLQCGTIYPVWMFGSVPNVSDGEVYRTACFSDQNGCCSRQWLIRVKNCGSYRVYYLKKTDACSSAYCIEKSLYTTTPEETSSSSSSSQDVTSTSMESIESGNIDTTTTSETTTDIPTTTTSVSTISSPTTSRSTATTPRSIVHSSAPKSIVTDPQIVNNEDLKTSPPISPESTQSQVVQAGPTNILVYILAVAVGVLLLTTLVIAVVLHRFRRKRKKEKQNVGETSEASKQPQNGYSELPNSETIYYSIEYDKEAENNKENERIASAQERDMYLDACHQLAVSDVDVKYDVASEIEEVSALGNREMYLDAIRGSVINHVTGRPDNTYHDPYECSIRDTESHSYAKLPNTMLKTQLEYSNGGYEPELQDKKRKSAVECANRGSIVSYDDVTFDLK